MEYFKTISTFIQTAFETLKCKLLVDEKQETSPIYLDWNSNLQRWTRADPIPSALEHFADQRLMANFHQNELEQIVPIPPCIWNPEGNESTGVPLGEITLFSPSGAEFQLATVQTDVKHPVERLPYGQRKSPDQLGWIEWLYLAITT